MKRALALAVIAVAVVLFWNALGESSLPAGPHTSTSGAPPSTAEAATVDGPAAPPRVEIEHETPPARERDAEDSTFALRVVTARGDPAPGARVWIFDTEHTHTAITDPTGSLTVPALPGAGSVLVVPDARPPLLRAFDRFVGEHEIVLPDGAALAGQVLVDRAPATESIVLELVLDDVDPLAGLPEALRDAVTEALGTRHSSGSAIRTSTTATGDFRFEGLPRACSGALHVGRKEPYRIAFLDGDGVARGVLRTKDYHDRRALVPEPRTDLVLPLHRLPVVTGRVVWSDGVPVSEGSVAVRAHFADGENTPVTSVSLKADGTFALGLMSSDKAERSAIRDPDSRSPVVRLDIWWYVRNAGQELRTWEDAEVPADLDVGDIVIERPKLLHFLARGPGGAPLEGAVVEGLSLSRPSGADGRGEVVVADTARREFRVVAPGHAVERQIATGAGTPEDPLRFVLHAASEILVDVQAPGMPLPELQLRVHSSGPMFTAMPEDRFGSTSMHWIAGTPRSDTAGRKNSGEQYVVFALEDASTVTLSSLEPGVTLDLVLCDRLGQPAAEQRCTAPPPGTRERVELRMTRPIARVRGEVTDPGGRPLAETKIMFDGERVGFGVETDEHGRFDQKLVASGKEVTVVVDHSQFAAVAQRVALVDGTPELSVRLETAYELDVRVTDASGAPIDARAWISEDLPGVARHEITTGVMRFSRLPRGTVTVKVRDGEEVVERRVEVPRGSPLEIRIGDR